MLTIVIGNIVALVASIIMVYSGLIKQKKKMIYFQTIQIALAVVSNLILGGVTGAIINVLCLIRNILCYKDKLDFKAKIFLIVSSTILSLVFNNLGFIGLLPLISTIIYTLLMNIKDVVKFKYLNIVSTSAWFVYDIFIKLYTAAIFDFSTIIANIIAIIQIKFKKNKTK